MTWKTPRSVVRESDAILNLIYDHLATGLDFHIRVKYAPGSVVLWVRPFGCSRAEPAQDNRITAHTAILGSLRSAVISLTIGADFDDTGFRHAGRLTAQAERPFLRT